MSRFRSGITAVLVVALSVPPAAEEPEKPGEPGGPALRLEVPRRADGGEGALDWVIGKVSSADDRFVGERISARVVARLDELAEWVVTLRNPFEVKSLGPLLAPEFGGARLVPVAVEPFLDRDGRRAWRDRTRDGKRELDAARWSAELSRLGAVCGEVRKAKFKVFRFESGDDADVGTRVLLEMDGQLATGEYAQVRTVWDVVWTMADAALRISSVDRVSYERAVVAKRVFSDVSDEALGASRSYREQLSRGVGYWRHRVDSASGIDVYGHQGIAVGDYDGDELDDIYVSQPAGLPNRLYRNLGDGRFLDVSRKAGVDVLDNTGGVLFVDLDNDGDNDLVAVTSLEVLLFENINGRSFRRRRGSGLETVDLLAASTLGCAAADYDKDGDLDLYVFSYVFWAGSASKLQSSYPYPYHDANNGAPNFLFRNRGRLRFEDVTKSSGLTVGNRRFSLAASWAAYDDDGDPDLYVANDFGKNNLYRNDGGRFRDVAEELGVDDVGNGMSVTWEDFDNDGRIDLLVGNMWSSAGRRIAGQPEFETDKLRSTYLRMARGNSLFRNLGDGRFEDVSIRSGAFFARWSWSAQFLDVEGDGHEDLYVVNGFISNEKKDDL